MLSERLTQLQHWVADVAVTDDGLRTRLLSDPAGTIRKEWPEFELDKGVTLRCLEQSDERVYVILPHSYRSDTPPDPNESPIDFILYHARRDVEFKRRLVADPKEALRAVGGVELGSDAEVVVLEERQNEHFLVVPKPATIGRELDASELEMVSGGDSLSGPSCVGGCSAAGCVASGCCSTNSQSTCHGVDFGGMDLGPMMNWNAIRVRSLPQRPDIGPKVGGR